MPAERLEARRQFLGWHASPSQKSRGRLIRFAAPRNRRPGLLQRRELHPRAFTVRPQSRDRPDHDRHLGSLFGSHRGSAAHIRWSEADAFATRCLKGSGSQQITKYRSDLQELARVAAAARQRERSDVIGLRATIGLELGKQ